MKMKSIILTLVSLYFTSPLYAQTNESMPEHLKAYGKYQMQQLPSGAIVSAKKVISIPANSSSVSLGTVKDETLRPYSYLEEASCYLEVDASASTRTINLGASFVSQSEKSQISASCTGSGMYSSSYHIIARVPFRKQNDSKTAFWISCQHEVSFRNSERIDFPKLTRPSIKAMLEASGFYLVLVPEEEKF